MAATGEISFMDISPPTPSPHPNTAARLQSLILQAQKYRNTEHIEHLKKKKKANLSGHVFILIYFNYLITFFWNYSFYLLLG